MSGTSQVVIDSCAASVGRKLTDFQRPEELFDLIQNQRLRDLIAIIATDGKRLPGDNRPDWAARAAIEFWRCCQDFPKSKKAASENYRLGYFWARVTRLCPDSMRLEPALAEILSPEDLSSMLHNEMAKAPPLDAADFYAGFADGLKREDFSPSPPFVIYLVFAVMWAEISTLKNLTAIHRFLEANLGSNLTGTRDRIAKICQKIRLPLTDKGGRPKGKPRKLVPH